MNTFEKNYLSYGIIITAVITFILFLIFLPFHLGLGTEGDIFVIVGTIFGCYFAFRYRKNEQITLWLGIKIGLGGALLATILESFFYFIFFPNILLFFLFILYFIVFYLLFGFMTGYIMAMMYIRKQEKPKDTSVQIKGLEHLEED